MVKIWKSIGIAALVLAGGIVITEILGSITYNGTQGGNYDIIIAISYVAAVLSYWEYRKTRPNSK